MAPEQHVKFMMGELMVNVATLTSQVEALATQNNEMKARLEFLYEKHPEDKPQESK